MAQYRLSLSIASRAKGRSAVAMAAYRAGEAMKDERTGEQFNFTHKRGILYAEMVLPDHAPEWAHDRAVFWNRSEAADKRQDAQIAREMQLSLPHELSDQERRALTIGFAGEVAARFGIAVDTCIHAPNHQGDERNYHAHLLLSTRSFDDQKTTGFGNKIRALDNIAQKRGGQQSEVEQLRQQWAQLLNEALQRADIRTNEGAIVEMDHRSYKRQGVAQEPTVKEGIAATGLKRRGETTERAAINADIRARNAQRDRMKDQIGSADREVEELKQLIAGESGAPPHGAISTHTIMNDDELKKVAGIAEFRAHFDAFLERCRTEDAAQSMRAYDIVFDLKGNLKEQLFEFEQRMDREFDADDKALKPQFHEDRSKFEDWLQGERDRMRAEDAARHPQHIEPRPVPTFGLIPGAAQTHLVTQNDPLFKQKEGVRSEAADEMRKEFGEFQKQRHADRAQRLYEHYDRNLEQLEPIYKQAVKRREMEEALNRPRQASQRTADDLQPDLKPPQEQNNFKIKKGETEEQARERYARLDAARLKREEEAKKDGRDPHSKKDDWGPR